MRLCAYAHKRKNALFYKTMEGARVGDVITSLIATCELGGINIFHYLTALQRNRWNVGRQPELWLPGNYQQQLNEELAVA